MTQSNPVDTRWFEPTGDVDNDLDALLGSLIKARQEANDEEFDERFNETRVNGVIAAYPSLSTYATAKEFVLAASKSTKWEDHESECLDDIEAREPLLRFLAGLPKIPLTAIELLRASAEERKLYEVGKDGDTTEYDRVFVLQDGGMWTDHMGPCITVGMTAIHNGTRYNAMIHSFGEFDGANIIRTLQETFDDTRAPAYGTLTHVGYFVMGGHPDRPSWRKAEELLKALRDDNLPVLGVHLTNSYRYRGIAKAVLITADGQLLGTSYRPQK
jgi:hypothetical protein